MDEENMPMKEAIQAQIAALKNKAIPALQEEYERLFSGQKASSDNKVYLVRRIAYRLQELEYGDLSQETKARIAKLTEKYDPINNKFLRPQVTSAGKNIVSFPFLRDKRLPIPGTIIHKKYKKQDISVKVLEKGFEYKNKFYRTLSSIAQEITGAHWNGYNFFNL